MTCRTSRRATAAADAALAAAGAFGLAICCASFVGCGVDARRSKVESNSSTFDTRDGGAGAATGALDGAANRASPHEANDELRASTLDARLERLTSSLRGLSTVGTRQIAGDGATAVRETFTFDGEPVRGDRCVRLAFVATRNVRVLLEDAHGPIGAATGPLTDAFVGERGPVCTLHGEVISVRVVASGPFEARVTLLASR